MSFEAQKITDAEIAAAGVQSQPNKLTGTAQQNKAVFDALVKNLVKIKLNALVDELLGGNAAGQIGIDTVTGLEAENVQAALEEIMQNLQGITQGAVADGSVTAAKLAAGAVTEAKLASSAVTADKLAGGAVTTPKLGDLAVTTAKIALLAVTTALLADGAVTTDKLGNLAVTTAKIANAAVDNTKLALGAVTAVKLSEGAVTESRLADRAVTHDKIGLEAVRNDNIRNEAVTANKIADNNVLFDHLYNFSVFDVETNGTIHLTTTAGSRAILFTVSTADSSNCVYGVNSNASNSPEAVGIAHAGQFMASGSAGFLQITPANSAAKSCLLIVLAGSVTAA